MQSYNFCSIAELLFLNTNNILVLRVNLRNLKLMKIEVITDLWSHFFPGRIVQKDQCFSMLTTCRDSLF